MIQGLFGRTSMSHLLRGGLEETMETHRQIAARIANALKTSSTAGFSESLDAANAGSADGDGQEKPNEVDLQRDMSLLADTEIRYEVEAKLLRGTYSRWRTALGKSNNA
jgi:flagellar basal body rod protein FlgB